MNESDYFLQHTWGWCPMCEEVVFCAKCGLNQCSAGSGTLLDGSDCDACPSAYDLMMHGTPDWRVRPAGWFVEAEYRE